MTPRLYAFSTDLPTARVAELEGLLSPRERERAGRFHFEADRVRFVVSHGLLRTILGEHLSVSPGSIEYASGIHGKPVVKGRPDGIEFSLSRSRDGCAVAVTHTAAIGIDIEAVRPLDQAFEIAKNRFTPAESATVNSPEKFFKLWTRKESVAKCLGWGLALPFDVFEVDGATPASEHVTIAYQGEQSDITLSDAVLGLEGFVGSVAQMG